MDTNEDPRCEGGREAETRPTGLHDVRLTSSADPEPALVGQAHRAQKLTLGALLGLVVDHGHAAGPHLGEGDEVAGRLRGCGHLAPL